jgi:hypothetical protein
MDEAKNPWKSRLSGGLHGWIFVRLVVNARRVCGLARAHRGADAAPLAVLHGAALVVLEVAALGSVYRGADTISTAMFVLVVTELFVEYFFRIVGR